MRYINILSTKKFPFHILLSLLLVIVVGYIAYYTSTATQLIIDIYSIFSQYKLLLSIILILLFIIIYVTFLKYCRQAIYLLLDQKEKFIVIFNLKWAKSFNINGEIIKLCIKEIIRSQLKRIVFNAVFLLIVCLYLFSYYEGYFLIRCFITLLPILILGRIYGENTFNIESTFFDKLMVLPQNVPYLILKSKYILSVIHAAFNTIVYIIVFFNRSSMLLWISTFFFGCGIFLFFIFQNVVYNNQRYDILVSIRKFSDFTFVSISLLLLITLLSSFILVTIKGLTSEKTTECVMLITGIAGMVASPFWLKNIYHRFLVRKYRTMDTFRNS